MVRDRLGCRASVAVEVVMAQTYVTILASETSIIQVERSSRPITPRMRMRVRVRVRARARARASEGGSLSLSAKIYQGSEHGNCQL